MKLYRCVDACGWGEFADFHAHCEEEAIRKWIAWFQRRIKKFGWEPRQMRGRVECILIGEQS
jgi:hypothetical protein